MANRISTDERKMILRLLLEGMSIRSVSRITGCHKTTVAKTILAFGESCRIFLDEKLRGLTLNHLEVDEVWSYVGKKQARLTIQERAERGDIGDMFLWTALDQETKLIACYALGKRTGDMARRFMVDLAGRLVLRRGGDNRIVTQLSTDGFVGYPEAVDLAFGRFIKFGVIIKEYRNAKMNYNPSEMVGAQRRSVRRINENEINTICTSHVERNNGTLRTFIKRMSRLTNGFSKKLDNHAAAIAMFIAYYNFVWRTRHSDGSGCAGKLRPTAAMMAKITDHLWSFDEFYETVSRYN